ncbi:hypothetical protein Glove_214g53 [Diversispora epigaea]|uniref:Uncharacterized protein n=1 Tax=Diversispora epigaea TaxID=1348612 RepID=A0A397IQQ2_9GLOM|nr:hypothetical protein Glove_214g53 [Diversispora epigaea]
MSQKLNPNITNPNENIFNSPNLLKTDSEDTLINCENENESFFDEIHNTKEKFTFEFNIESLLAAKQIVLDEELSETDSENGKEQDDFIEIQSLPPEISDLDKIDDETIEHRETKNIMPCAIIDIIDGKIQRCGSSDKLRPLYQLIEMWQVAKSAVEEVNKQLENLGICYSHFIFDQNKLHKKNLKQKILTERKHSKAINNKNIQVPYIGQYSCPALKIIDPIVTQSSNDYRPRYICCICYKKNGGHLHIKAGGPGKRNWILAVAKSNNNTEKENLLKTISPIFQLFSKSTSQSSLQSSSQKINSVSFTLNEIPSLFLFKILLKLVRIETSKETELDQDECFNIGKKFAIIIWNSHQFLEKDALRKPDSLITYYNAFPKFLSNFFEGLFQKLFEFKKIITNRKQKQRGNPLKTINLNHIHKIVTLFNSIIFNLAFKNSNLWLPNILSSLCRKTKLFSSFYKLLVTMGIISHSDRHERRLEKVRMNNINPTERLIFESNIWNLAVIDNIDFKERTFAYGNIYDVTRGSSHATLRMVFQCKLPQHLSNSTDEIIELDKSFNLFGMNNYTINILNIFSNIFNNTLDFKESPLIFERNFNAESLHEKILIEIQSENSYSPLKVVILEAGDAPNEDSSIFEACEMYIVDLSLKNNKYIDICADEAIFRRLLHYRELNSFVRPILGAWHTNKDMCSVLLAIFSSYGIFDLAIVLGVRFLDKLESVVDYRSTVRVFELIWVAVGIVIHVYLKKTNKKIEDIVNDNNIPLKVWFHYYQWAGISSGII